MESALLTAMGALGSVCGFSGIRQSKINGISVVGRGLDSPAMVGIEDAFENLIARYFPALEITTYPLRSDILMVPFHSGPPDPLNAGRIRLLAGWRMGAKITGLMGLGGNLKGRPFDESEIDFLYRLMDQTMAAIRAIEAKSVIHTLKNELDQTRQHAADTTQRHQAARRALEESRFRLSGFNDIFQELSGLRENVKVLDAFLLVMLGIFSARSGSILYHDDNLQKAHVAMRGGTADSARPYTALEVKETLDAVFGSMQRLRPAGMQAAIVPLESLKAIGLIPSDTFIGVSFSVDPTTRGLLCLGKRLVDTQYGAKEGEMLLAFTHTFLASLKNSHSFETITRLHAEQQQRAIELEKTVQALSESRSMIAGLERAADRLKSAIAGVMARSTRVSLRDVALILIAGTVLGLVYNLASPSGVSVVPPVWRYPASPAIDAAAASALLASGTIILVDARPAEFHKQRHIRGAINLPPALFDFVYMMHFSQIDGQTPIVVYGRSISRHYDEEVAHMLRQRGHANVSILDGGMKTWPATGLTDIS